MRRILALPLMTMLPAGCSPADPPAPRLAYPKAATGPVVDDYGGTKVPDPYRWMESLDSKEVAEWVAASNAVTEPYLKALPLRQPFVTRLTALWNYPRVGLPYVVDSGALFYARNSGLQRQAPIYRRALAHGRAVDGARPERHLRGRLGLGGAVVAVARRIAARLRPGRRRRRLADGEGAHRRHRAGSRSTRCAGCASRTSRGRRTARASSTRAIRSRRRTRCSRRRSPTTRSTTTASARRSRRTCSCTSARTCPSGSSAAPCPRTAATCSC